jgi:beta-glucosidase 2, glycosyl-hydrolase family 116 N-term
VCDLPYVILILLSYFSLSLSSCPISLSSSSCPISPSLSSCPISPSLSSCPIFLSPHPPVLSFSLLILLSYSSLFGRSWTVYECPVPGVRVCIRQISPFLPHSYSEASLPVSVFDVEVENIAEGGANCMSSIMSFNLSICVFQ